MSLFYIDGDGTWTFTRNSGSHVALPGYAILYRDVVFRRFDVDMAADAIACWNALQNGADPLSLEPESNFALRWELSGSA